jgi:hypothetical protein
MTLTDARARLIRLQAERLAALEAGVQEPSPYMARLSDAIAEARMNYTISAVVDIASLRNDLAGLALL